MLILALQAVLVQGAPSAVTPPPPRSGHAAAAVAAVRIERGPTLDGRLDDAAWQTATTITELTQSDPDEGRPVSERTEIRVVYDGSALYVGARLFDRNPAAIVRRMGRRDVSTPTDEFQILLDSYHDHRTSFLFAVSPAGVQRDAVAGDDGDDYDYSWDAVWQSAASMDSLGWTVEIRIPFSQLRFSSAPAQQWGVRFVRQIQRKNETALFPFVAKTETGVASRFAHLDGLRDLNARRPIELLPYTVVRQRFNRPDEPGDPFDNGHTSFSGAGLDLKAGVTSNITLDFTANPDFGQVELDPSYVNLTEFEQFLSEHRPFFVEGASIFKFGGTGGGMNPRFDSPLLFYSRRIGRPPQGKPFSSGDFTTAPENTTILGAAKLSGKTANGWSIGAVEALTAREYATVAYTASDGQRSEEVEPLTNHFATRIKRDLGRGRTTLGLAATAVHRDLDQPSLDFLNSSAYAGGVDFQHRWQNQTYSVAASLSGSTIQGDVTAIQAAQRRSDRYYQRPDAHRVRYDPAATSLSGLAGDLYLNKTGGNWVWTLAGSTMSPGFEVNDLGFQKRVDLISTSVAAGYKWTKPAWIFRQAYVNLSTRTGWNYDGDMIQRSVSAYGFGRFQNFIEANLSLSYTPSVLDDRLTRGGPLARKPAGWFASTEAYTDNRKPVSVYGYMSYQRNSAGGWYMSVLPSFTYRPSKALSLSLGLEYDAGWSAAQSVTRVTDSTATATLGRRYVFAGLRQQMFDASLRVNAAFSRSLSLQVYGQPFTFIGDYDGFRELAARRTYTFNSYGRDNGSTIDTDGSTYTVDPDGAGTAKSFSFDNPDFRSRSLNLTSVLRWEYRPGSTIFFVWSQTRSGDFSGVDVNLMNDVRQAMFLDRPTNVFQVKVNCWLRP
jgi:uncharacterized protein DUF5916/cellulose/xylan binding protein with CBM9 domain